MGLYREGLGLLIVAGTVFPRAAMSTEVVAEVYPNRPITLVVGFPPGDSSDVIARHLAARMTKDLGQKVIVENRPGAAGNLGAAEVAGAKPDGYTVYLAVRPVALHKLMYRYVSFDFAKDFVPVGMVAGMPYVLLMGKHVAADGMQAALALARDNPGKFTCATGGISTTSHLLCELLQEQAGVKWWHVPYNGAIAALNDVLGGHADFCVASLVTALPYLASGKVGALAVFSERRVAAAPSVPSIAEFGVNVEGEGWAAVVTPAGTPSYVVARLNSSIRKVLGNKEIQKKLIHMGFSMPSMENTPETLGAFLETDTAKWTAILQDHQIKGLQ